MDSYIVNKMFTDRICDRSYSCRDDFRGADEYPPHSAPLVCLQFAGGP
jgi:hypothetical protein